MIASSIEPDQTLIFLGRIAGVSQGLWRMAGRLETRILKEQLPGGVRSPIFVAGLARAGTTILLEMLNEIPGLASHRYRDFPFINTPVAWSWFCDRAMKKDTTPVERVHKDRILVTPESPEAIEEMLWMQHFPSLHDPQSDNVLGPSVSNPEFEKEYIDHIRKILYLRGGTRYLSKGNYNLTRLGYILKIFPDAKIVIPVREPVAHLSSLMKQHTFFCREEERDYRVLEMMKRFGHYEFGLCRSAINTGNAEEIHRLWDDGQEVRGWAKYWASLYGFVVKIIQHDPNVRKSVVLVSYEALCSESIKVLKKIYSHCKLDVPDETINSQALRLSAPDYYSQAFNVEELDIIRQETTATREEINQLY